MKVLTQGRSVRRLVWLSMVSILVAAPRALGTVIVVQFGGVLGEAYSPSSFFANVGDTVRWIGDFTVHPLSSTTIPPGASSWHNDTGTSFDYVIPVAGTYNYQCDVHAPLMVGSFTALVTGVGVSIAEGSPTAFRLEQNYPNPFNPSTVVSYALPVASVVRLIVYDVLGREVAVLVNRQEDAGVYRVQFDGAGLASGVYEYRLTARNTDAGSAGSFEQSRKMLLTR